MLADELRGLSHSEFLELSRSIYAGLLALLEGVSEHGKLFNGADLGELKSVLINSPTSLIYCEGLMIIPARF